MSAHRPGGAVDNGAPQQPLVSARGLTVHFERPGGWLTGPPRKLTAVDEVTLDLHSGKTLGLVGESGCGKTTLGRALVGLVPPSAGSVSFAGQDLQGLQGRDRFEVQGRAQMVFQDPHGSLNPRLSVGATLREVLEVHRLADGNRAERVSELLEMVGLRPAQAGLFPHELSGGQRQRVGIARALAVEPDFVVLDEPVAALDVSVQAQVLNLLAELQRSLGLTYLFISHDLAVVEHVSDRIAVMYLGRIVESAAARALQLNPGHPYTRALVSAAPSGLASGRARTGRIILKGEVPSPLDPPAGCAFHTRCQHPARDEACAASRPALRDVEDGHFVACPKGPESP